MNTYRYLATVVAFVVLFAEIRGNSFVRSTPKVFSSPSGAFRVRKQPSKVLKNPRGRWEETEFIVYRLEADSQSYVEAARFTAKGHPREIFINDSGSHIVTLDQCFSGGWGPRIIIVYDTAGKLLKQWSLEDIYGFPDAYDPSKHPKFRMAGSSIRWRGDGSWSLDQTVIGRIGTPVASVDIADDGTITHVDHGEHCSLHLNLPSLEITDGGAFHKA